jgi:tRNA nucleotidyltransferase/poly(A) polymerase
MGAELWNKAMSLLRTIESLGSYKAYIVGGALRDLYLENIGGLKDIDIATNCPIEVLSAKLATFEIGRSMDFGIVGIHFEGANFEVAQFRADGEYLDGRRPASVKIVDNIRGDLKRRDFTVNALALGTNGQIVDIVGGVPDIMDKIIRAVGNPEDRFREDHLRMVRAARFATMDGFKIEKKTRRAIRRLSPLVKKVSPERITLELRKAAEKTGPQFAKFLLVLDDLKLLSKILPEVHALKYFRHDMEHHPEGPTVFDHTIECIRILEDQSWISKLAAMFHDVGKSISFQEDKGWKMGYWGHAQAGSKLVHHILTDRFHFHNHDRDAIVYAVDNHMKFHRILEMKPAKIARMVSHPAFQTLCDVAWADEFSRGEKFAHYGEYDEKLNKAVEIKEKWENRIINPSTKLVDGNHVMELTGLKPCRLVGEIKREVEDSIINGEIAIDDRESIDELIIALYELRKENSNGS